MEKEFVLRNLSETGRVCESMVWDEMQEIFSKPRHLDAVPHQVKLAPIEKVETCGMKEEFKKFYNMYVEPDAPEKAEIVMMNGMSRKCDYPIYVALRSLIMTGVTADENRAIACRNLFITIINSNDTDITMSQVMSDVLELTGEYYHDTLCSAVVEMAYTEAERIRYTLYKYSIDRGFINSIIADNNLYTYEIFNNFVKNMLAVVRSDKKYSGKKRGAPNESIIINYLYETTDNS